MVSKSKKVTRPLLALLTDRREMRKHACLSASNQFFLCVGVAAYLFGFTICPTRPNKCAAIVMAKRPGVPGRKGGERNRKSVHHDAKSEKLSTEMLLHLSSLDVDTK